MAKAKNNDFQIVFRTSDAELKNIQLRKNNDLSSEHQVAKRDLERYYNIMNRALKEISLTENEAMAIVDSLNGTMIDSFSIGLIWANLEDAISLEGLDSKWGIDGQALVEKMKNASIGYLTALADAIERWWATPGELSNAEKLKAVKLI